MPGLTAEEQREFLDEDGHLMRLGTVDRGGRPRVVPIWFMHDDGKLWFTPRARSAWLDDLRANPAVCCTIDESVGGMRKVVARGVAVLEHDLGDDAVWRDRYRVIACRYTPPEFADAYIADTIDEPRALYSLRLADADVATWRMPVRPGENPLAVWGRQYYHR
jgi:hypothetical protein